MTNIPEWVLLVGRDAYDEALQESDGDVSDVETAIDAVTNAAYRAGVASQQAVVDAARTLVATWRAWGLNQFRPAPTGKELQQRLVAAVDALDGQDG